MLNRQLRYCFIEPLKPEYIFLKPDILFVLVYYFVVFDIYNRKSVGANKILSI